MANKAVDRSEAIPHVFGERQGLAYELGDPLPQDIIEALDMVGFRACLVIAVCCSADIIPGSYWIPGTWI